jgi:hypothetical protein
MYVASIDQLNPTVSCRRFRSGSLRHGASLRAPHRGTWSPSPAAYIGNQFTEEVPADPTRLLFYGCHQ